MSRWDPHLDLVRLLEALGREILAASDDEVRGANAGRRRAVRAAADQVRQAIGTVVDDVADPIETDDLDATARPALHGREHRVRQH